MRVLKAIGWAICVALLLGFTFGNAEAAPIKRSAAAVSEFKRTHYCPATKLKGNKPCPGYIVDHRKALCDGGADRPGNMQYQTLAASKAKDRTECKSAWAKAHGHYH